MHFTPVLSEVISTQRDPPAAADIMAGSRRYCIVCSNVNGARLLAIFELTLGLVFVGLPVYWAIPRATSVASLIRLIAPYSFIVVPCLIDGTAIWVGIRRHRLEWLQASRVAHRVLFFAALLYAIGALLEAHFDLAGLALYFIFAQGWCSLVLKGAIEEIRSAPPPFPTDIVVSSAAVPSRSQQQQTVAAQQTTRAQQQVLEQPPPTYDEVMAGRDDVINA